MTSRKSFWTLWWQSLVGTLYYIVVAVLPNVLTLGLAGALISRRWPTKITFEKGEG